MPEHPEPPRGKRIVVCLDGTANQIGAGNLTNVAKLFEMLEKDDPVGQLAYYDPGVGTLAPASAHSSLSRAKDLLFEQAFGLGLKGNVAQAYRYVMQHWRPGDALYIFGFSRGAYTARALAGMLLRPGLLRPGSENLLPYAVEKYAINRYFTEDEYAHWAEFARAFCWRTEGEPLFSTVRQNSPNQVWYHAVPVAYLGLWDTVKAAGFLRFGNLRWPYTRSLPNVARIRHAVSIDERRRPYREYLVERHPRGLEERWFAGVHADVGGTFMPDHRLATIALKWVTDGIVGELAIDAAAYRQQCAVTEDFADAPIHHNGKLWYLVGCRRRPMGPDALVHPSVLVRRRDDPGYLPNLTEEAQRLSADPTDWTSPAL
ncbi:DUF2235 domain-containing protein [Mycobacterium sp. 852014-50255_SCH5639931]|uniref:DUF2235 domain-containing protein n=1 Tax=Mycobacterium sp. 852014-50255_SCH5639931 TaxID=1834112 RepID=UPI0007FD5308|nr:DUF2235 domain-containing protein [Mycobacterium sp. 852014-50255_SCH5639931]OBB67292.1 hypothetical protein A5758_12655 [Mycobacterium sp. 852014-50255_SCH5639931]